jgi:zinc/manganese transport system substrate-binding protein
MPRPRTLSTLLALLVLCGAVAGGCGDGAATGEPSGRLDVVAAEDFWGSIAEQLGGDQVEVTSVIANPAADPHEYEPSSEDAREMAAAKVVIFNGIGYDQWAQDLIEANPSPGRAVVEVGDVLGLAAGENPHQWYSPGAVQSVIARISAEYKRADPGHSAYFDHRRQSFETAGLAEYRRLIATIKAKYAGTPVGASESIFEPLAPALGLRLLTPRGFMDAVAEGTEPSPADKVAADEQLQEGKIRLWVFNGQNATPDVQRLNDEAKAAGIPIATVTETLTPEGTSFQDWISKELRGIEAALARSGG